MRDDPNLAYVEWFVIDISGKWVGIRYVEGPVGVHSRNFSQARSGLLGWQAQTMRREGIAKMYAWVEGKVRQYGNSGDSGAP